MQLPHDIAERVDRVLDYHRATKLSLSRTYSTPVRPPLSGYRPFEGYPKVALPTTLLDAPASMLEVLAQGHEALQDSHRIAPQDMKTLATWLHMATGVIGRQKCLDDSIVPVRSWPSAGLTYPCDVYIGAWAIAGLEPGLYHFSPSELVLRRLRDGPDALAHITRGRPDLNFIKNTPGMAIISTTFSRATWRYKRRSYRALANDAGRLVQNLVTVGTALGMQTLARLSVNDRTARELIGLSPDVTFNDAEAAQAVVVWADRAEQPLALRPSTGPLEPIPRAIKSIEAPPFASVLAVHEDCVAPGMALKEIRPPLTEISAVSDAVQPEEVRPPFDLPESMSVRRTLFTIQPTQHFSGETLARDALWTMSRLAFRGGSFWPMKPDGPHVGIVRPIWLTLDVSGLDAGIWHYDPLRDHWVFLRRHSGREKIRQLFPPDPDCISIPDAAAICFLIANVNAMAHHAGPDVYRLANIEAGVVAQRLHLASTAIGLTSVASCLFYDDAARAEMGIEQTGWEILHAIGTGTAAQHDPPDIPEEEIA